MFFDGGGFPLMMLDFADGFPLMLISFDSSSGWFPLISVDFL